MSEVKQVMIRASEEEHQRWKDAAEKLGLTMSDFLRTHGNGGAAEVLDCSHPIEDRKTYPWSEKCLRCGERIR